MPRRITAGHLAVLAELAATARSLEVILFDGAIGAGWDWSDRDKAMAGRLLAAAPAPARTLVVAGNAHTPTRPQLGIPMGARLHRQRPGVREIRINYGSGRYYNTQPCRFTHPGPAAPPNPAPPGTRLARPRPPHSRRGDRAPPIPGDGRRPRPPHPDRGIERRSPAV
jgi:hypothetical protein